MSILMASNDCGDSCSSTGYQAQSKPLQLMRSFTFFQLSSSDGQHRNIEQIYMVTEAKVISMVSSPCFTPIPRATRQKRCEHEDLIPRGGQEGAPSGP